MSDDFYRAFEEKHRGSRELIKSRQRVYLPFIKPLVSLYEDPQAIDLGCGRGEWLEILKEAGINGHGVDLDDGMLAVCRKRGLSVTTQDAISALNALPDESQLIVSGFHIAEHIQFSDLQLLVREALRVLKPAGLLILETPNAENIIVGTVNFYLDPTHQKPIPPQLLSFLPEYYGFTKVKVIRLQEDKALAGRERISLIDVLGGVSPDYAVVAQKIADNNLLECTNDAFARDYGLTLSVLAEKFDYQAMQANELIASAEVQAQQVSERTISAEDHARQASERAAMAEGQAQQANERAATAEAKVQQISERFTLAEAQAQQANERAVVAVSALTAVFDSTSWRLTAPLRTVGRKAKALLQWPGFAKSEIKTKAKLLLAHASLYVNRRPQVRHTVLVVLARFPALKARLKVASTTSSSFSHAAATNVPNELINLTPRARQIYIDLKDAMNRRKMEQN